MATTLRWMVLDHTPFHFNESGSQMNKSLHWRGVPAVPLNQLSSAVRARWSATTYASTRPDRFLEFPPLEALSRAERSLSNV